MDGGGHDHMGHAGGDGGGFYDSGHDHGGHDHGHFADGGHDHGDHGHFHEGGHDHGGHDHGAHGHSGERGNFLSQALGLDQKHHGHNFISHLLGLDHDAHHHGHMHDGGHGGEAGNQYTAVSQMPIWTSALQSMKLSHFTKGITISANFWLLMMFMGFTSWLFVVYWIRHHEPLANAVIGTRVVGTPTANYDRRMLAGIREAFPARVSPDGGQIFVPSPKGTPDPLSNDVQPQIYNAGQPAISQGTYPVSQPSTAYQMPPQTYQTVPLVSQPMIAGTMPSQPYPVQPIMLQGAVPMPSSGAVPFALQNTVINTQEGARVKMIVNR